MRELGFPPQFLSWVMKCITAIQYTILINVMPCASFQVGRGLRQGDPMSPFLFAIDMEYLSICMVSLGEDSRFKYHPKCHRTRTKSVLFADDLLVFSKADELSMKAIMEQLEKFSKASGLYPNVDKSEVYFVGISADTQDTLASFLHMKIGSLPFRYLDVPLSSKKLTCSKWKGLIDKITARVSHWTARTLSYAVRLQLIQSVLSRMKSF